MKTNQSKTNNAVSLIKGLVTVFVLLQLTGCFNAGGTGGPAYAAKDVNGDTTINGTTSEDIVEENIAEDNIIEESVVEENVAEEIISEEGISTSKALLNWTAPVAREDESPISMAEIAGYRVYYGTASGEYTQQLNVNDAYADEVVLDIVTGTYFLVITTIDVDGRESAFSDEVVLNV